MSDRLGVTKTYKLFIGGKFPRTESGRTTAVDDRASGTTAHVCRASRKDLRDAVEAARGAQAGWAGATAYLRGQILYRLGEMLEGKRAELVASLGGGAEAEREVDVTIDRTVAMAGWADKLGQVLGGANPVAGPYHNFTVPQATGVVGVLAPDEPGLLGLISLVLPAVVAGNAAVVLASATNPIPSMVLAEGLATSDLPGGVVNVLTGFADELAPHFASHRGIDAVVAADGSESATLRAGAAENLKRVTIVDADDWYDADRFESPWFIERVVELKTLWHPSAT